MRTFWVFGFAFSISCTPLISQQINERKKISIVSWVENEISLRYKSGRKNHKCVHIDCLWAGCVFEFLFFTSEARVTLYWASGVRSWNSILQTLLCLKIFFCLLISVAFPNIEFNCLLKITNNNKLNVFNNCWSVKNSHYGHVNVFHC